MVHKKWTISFRCLQGAHQTHTENVSNVSTVTKTLIKMFSMSTLRCNSQSFLKLSKLPAQSNLSDVNMFIYDIMNDVTKNI